MLVLGLGTFSRSSAALGPLAQGCVIVLLGPGLATHAGQLLIEIPDFRGDLQSHTNKVILALQVCQRVLWRSDARKKKKSTASSRSKGRPGGYAQWLQFFEEYAGIPALLEQLASKEVDVKRVRTLLYAAPLLGGIKSRRALDKLVKNLAAVQRHLDAAANLLRPFPYSPKERTWILGMLGWVRTRTEEHRHRLAEWRSAFTTIQTTDLIIAMIANDLETAGSRRVNEDLATLLTAAAVPGGTRDEFGWIWDAATVDKRRDRLKTKPFAALGPYRHLFENVNLEKLAKTYPALFREGNSKRRRDPETIGELLAAKTKFLSSLESVAAQQGSSGDEFREPPGRDKKLLKQS